MKQQATVKALTEQGAIVLVQRESACSGDCHKCSGCGAVKQSLQFPAENPIGAKPGDRVCVQSDTAVVLWAALLVYLLPLVSFFAAYLWAEATGRSGWIGAGGFVLGWIPALIYNAYVKRRPPVYVITEFVE